MLEKIKSKMKHMVAGVVATATVASAQASDVVTAVSTSAAQAQTDFGAIISAVAPVCFIIVIAVVGIGAATKLFRKGG